MNARSQAIARQNDAIDANVAKIEASKAPKASALAVMASRLGVSQTNLQDTLKATVFKNCSDAEFVSLVIVANEYNLNPLTKEIYAFSAKGGGIVPLVSIDGWVRIMNQHPQYDGIEFEDITGPDGKIIAIEATIYRKDRARPIKVIEYMDECKRNTDPWNKSPNRMLRHRALIQGARYAFGFSGIYADDEAEIQMIGEPVEARNITPPAPTRATVIDHNPETGEIIDNTPAEPPAYQAMVDGILSRITGSETVIDAQSVQKDWLAHAEALPDDVNAEIETALNSRLSDLKGAA